MQSTIRVQETKQVAIKNQASVKLDLIFIKFILAILVSFNYLISFFGKVKSFFNYLYSFSFVGYFTVYVALSTLSFLFIMFVVDANEIEQEGRFQANEHYIQLVESKNPEGIYISK